MKILLLSAYNAQSHQYWHEQLVEGFPEHHWTVLTLPPRYFAWRIRGNSLSWAYEQRKVLQEPCDLLIATSMVDLSALRGFVPELANIPTVLYFHENQFAYPKTAKAKESIEAQLLSIYSAACADAIAFNSSYNLESFFAGAKSLLTKLPDHVPKHLIEELRARSTVLPVPLRAQTPQRNKQHKKTLSIIWNHRWEYDKGPDILLMAARELQARSVNFELHVVGQQFRTQPKAFALLKETLGSKLGHWGYMENRTTYLKLLSQCDIALSTALHDFQGIALMEAVLAGCLPLAPERLAYPEIFPPANLYESALQDPLTPPDEAAIQQEAISIADRLQGLADMKQNQTWPKAPSLQKYTWNALKSDYEDVFNTTISAHDS